MKLPRLTCLIGPVALSLLIVYVICYFYILESVSSNFGVVLVICSNGKVVTANEVLAAGSQPRLLMETVIITLLHMALHSERIELEAVFMICGISAIEPTHRELVKIVLDCLSRQLNYSSRFKYLEELLGPILFCWATCSMSTMALVEGEKTDFSAKILELQNQLAIDKEEDEKMQDDKDNFLSLALDGYKRCLVIVDKYDVKVFFCLVSLWFGLCSRPIIINSMLSAIEEIQSYKFVPLVYQIASRMGGSKDCHGPNSFQCALVSLVKKMAVDHPYHTIFQLLALANGDRIKDKQHSRNSFVVDFIRNLQRRIF